MPRISLKITNIYEPFRKSFEYQKLIVTLNLNKNSAKFSTGSAAKALESVTCHEIWFKSLIPGSEIENLHFYSGLKSQDSNNLIYSKEQKIFENYDKLLILDQNLDQQFRNQSKTDNGSS